MPGKIYNVIAGIRNGCIATAENMQDKKILQAGKLHVYLFDSKHEALLEDGRHVNGLMSFDKLEHIGFFD